MLDLISLHIPKTAGTSFYAILQQIYAERLSISYRRRDIQSQLVAGEFPKDALSGQITILHGHFYYPEVAALHLDTNAKLICWLRDPIERLISNHFFFQTGLENPSRNPEQYELNKHRLGESLLSYGERIENRNRISQFLRGTEVEDFYFCGRMSHFAEDIQELAKKLQWPTFSIPTLNQRKLSSRAPKLSPAIRKQLQEWNATDLLLYRNLLTKRKITQK